jgi:hypothetical protein
MVTRIVCFIKPENICRNTVNQAAKDQEKDEFSHKGHKDHKKNCFSRPCDPEDLGGREKRRKEDVETDRRAGFARLVRENAAKSSRFSVLGRSLVFINLAIAA